MEENKGIEICMSRQTPLILPFEEQKVIIEIKNISNSEIIPPSPYTYNVWYPQEESLTNQQIVLYTKNLNQLIELDFRPRQRKADKKEQKVFEGPEYIKKIKKGPKTSKISLSDKIRVLEYINDHREYSWRFIGSVFGISHCEVRKIWLNQWNYSLLGDKRNNYRSTLTNDIKTKIDYISNNLDPTLSIVERANILNSDGYNVKPHQVYYYMKKSGHSYKRSRFHPYERKNAANVLKRQNFVAKFIDILGESKQIINIDEFGLDFSKRNYGWSKKGLKCLGFKTSIKRKYSVIIAVSSWNGIIGWRAIGENNNAKKFNHFIIDLTHYLYSQDRGFREYTAFLMDNSAIHTSTINHELYEKLGLYVIFGAPYTPQFAFVERVISYIKTKVKI